MGIARKLRKSLTTRGVIGTFELAFKVLLGRRRQLDPAERDFDRRYGIDTSGYIAVTDLDVTAETWIGGTAYQGLNCDTDFATWLSPHIAHYGEFSFVDVGSGKGRAVLLASRLPFRQCVGIEFSRALHETATRNLHRWPCETAAAGVTFLWGDALETRMPDGPLVIFLNNPFNAELMGRFAARFAGRTERLLVVYFTPHHAQAWDAVPGLKRVREQPGAIIWTNRE